MPYRSHYIEQDKRVAEPGIVSDMVRQFADKHAFLRELVQNGIDAGATRIDVRLDRDDTGIVRTSVTDDGAGMTRAIIEGPLLTLFSSSKEGDGSKIGKYGIGFVSVFALEPDVVEVQTRAGAESWLLKLFGDHSWELSEGDCGAATGTTVTLVQPMPVDEFIAHVTAATSALSRWCRHARVPIELVAIDAGDPTATRTLAISEPFGAPGLVSVSWQEDGERIVAATGGIDPSGSAFAGFYNRGLTLHETNLPEHTILGVRLKIDSPKLSHTLSRDDVVRDRELRRLLGVVKELVHEQLATALFARLTEAAAGAIAVGAYLPLLEAASWPTFASKRQSSVVVPLVDPVERVTTMTLDEIVRTKAKLLIADEPSGLTRALAAAGRPVVRWRALRMSLFAIVNDTKIEDADHAFGWAGPVAERHPGDDALEAAVTALLRKVGKNVAQAQLATFEGAGKMQPFRVAPEALVAAEDTPKRVWGKRATVFLNVEDAGVRLARRRAKTEPVVAAHLLCRALLVGDGPLDAKLVDRFLEAALE